MTRDRKHDAAQLHVAADVDALSAAAVLHSLCMQTAAQAAPLSTTTRDPHPGASPWNDTAMHRAVLSLVFTA